jgi:hypothetical protein
VEHIYNVFLFFQDDICSTIAYRAHDHSGSDKERIEFLRARLSDDLENAVRLNLTTPFTHSEYNARCRLGEGHWLYDEIFTAVGASASPLFVSTPVKNGEMFFNYSSEHGNLDMNDVAAKVGAKGAMDDWLVKYTDAKRINIPQLIHDDYFLAIKLTFNGGLYVSAMKLLVSCIDSLAYIEHGNQQGAFVWWLETYADLTSLGITAAELWELRNGILHMTNVNSKKVRQNKMRRISFRLGGPQDYLRDGADGIYYFDFYGLIQAFAEAQARWIETYNSDREKFARFVERYDETISDSRAAFTHLGGAGFEVKS